MILIRKAKTLYKTLKENFYRKEQRRKIKNTDFTIIANNCWGGGIYEELGLPYTTPTVGLFFYGPCYVDFLKNLKYNLSLEINFVEKSKYDIANQNRVQSNLGYPIGIINGCEIHFLHYHSREEAIEKWNRRKERVNFSNLYIAMSKNELVDVELMNQFNNLPFQNKVIFSPERYNNLKNMIYLPLTAKLENGGDLYNNPHLWRKEFDVIKWLNKN